MRVVTAILVLMMALPTFAFAQQQTCEQRVAVLSQLVDDMTRARASVSTAEVEAASLKVQVRTLQAEKKALEDAAQKPITEK